MSSRLIFTAVFAWMATGGLAFALLDRKAKRAPNDRRDQIANLETPEPQAAPAPFFSLGFTETIMVLGSVCLVFVAFVAIQFVYLFGGVRNIANFSYAEYARRGFAELIIVAVLTLGLALLLNVVAIRRTRRQTNIFRSLSTGLILLTAVILVSAFQRLRLYELTYGFTSLRLFIYVFIVWLGVLFAGFTLSLYWMPAPINVFPLTALIAVFGFVATLDILNPDAFVAWQNLNRGDIDPIYLSTLSEEAVPALLTLVDAPEPGLRDIVTHALSLQQLHLLWYQQHGDWRDFNLARSNAIALLDSIQDKLTPDRQFSRAWSLDELEAFLRKGMTTREVVRELGMPMYQLGAEFVGNDGRQTSNQKFVYVYHLGDMRRVRLQFDTAQGLESACIVRALEDSCTESITLDQR